MTLGPFSRRNFIHGQYATTPNSNAIRWSMEPASGGISHVFDSLNYGDSSPPAGERAGLGLGNAACAELLGKQAYMC